MTSIRKAALACMTTAMVALTVNAAAQTGPRNQDTYFTFSQPIELPNKTLPAGTYFFQLMDSDSNRHIVKIMSQDRKQLFATLMAIPFYSNNRPTDDPQVRFMETPATAANSGGTNAVKIWFYPGSSVGHEFIYPRSQALRIAARTGQPVLTTKTESEVTNDSELTRVDRNGTDTEANAQNSSQGQPAAQSQPAREPVGAIAGGAAQPATRDAAAAPRDAAPAPRNPAPAPRTAAPASRDAAPAPAAERTHRTDLPRTAGPLPLLALIGLGSLAGSRLVRKVR